MMKVLVTGGAGFLGSHMCDVLTDAGYETVVFDLEESQYLKPGQEMIIGDVTDYEAIKNAMVGCEYVYHYAAIADIAQAGQSAQKTFSVNVMGTINVLNAAVETGIARIFFSSSVYVFSEQGLFYRTSKQACEQLFHDYQKSYDLDYTILRFGSLYGPRADDHNAVRRMLQNALEEGKVNYPGTGKEIREYIHVHDAAETALDALKSEFRNEILHLTGRERMTTSDMVHMICEILGHNVKPTFNEGTRIGHYIQTPYSYMPKLGKRLQKTTYIDLGLGLLECVHDLDPAGKWQDTDKFK